MSPANPCDACGRPAVSDSMFRFVPLSKNKSALFCEVCHKKVINFVTTLIKNKGVID